MGVLVHENGSFTAKKNELITQECEKPVALKLLLQGRLNVYISASADSPPSSFGELSQKSYRLFEISESIFLNAGDLAQNCEESLSIAAAEDCTLYAYCTDTAEEFWSVVHNNKDYGTYIVNSICHLLFNSFKALEKAYSYSESLKNITSYYNAEPSVLFGKESAEAGSGSTSGPLSDDVRLRDKIEYYLHIYGLPADIKKSFFAADKYIASHHITEASLCLKRVLSELRSVFSSIDESIRLLYGNNEDGAYFAFAKKAIELKSSGQNFTSARDAFVYIYNKLNEISSYLKSEYDHETGIDFKYLGHVHKTFLSSLESETDIPAADIQASVQAIPEELINSAAKIIDYSEIPADKASAFMRNLNAFINLPDRFSISEEARKIRKAISDIYFGIYRAVFRKAHLTNDKSRLIKMFLRFGYMDERLLDTDQVLALYKLAGMDNTASVPNMFYADEWFARIYEMEKDPSINTFGQDYFDVFREMKKQGKVTDKDFPKYNNDREGRLSFEISHMLRANHKLCQNHLQTYFPILHRDAAPLNPVRSFVTPGIIREKLDKILSIDFSAFHREISYRNPDLNIEKEIVMMPVPPDIIFIPVYGSRASMWQELTGRVRTSPGRFIMPVFTDEDLDSMLVKLVGNFRWELCRTMAGSAWNDVSQGSLTADYTDYIQFYRKNRDLSTEAKERIKSLITKYNNRMRDIFTSEYEVWINNESKGNPRLNKVARGIFARHCPFGKEIRRQLEKQPLYAELFAALNIQREKQAKNLEQRYSRYRKINNGILDPVLEENLKFYADM